MIDIPAQNTRHVRLEVTNTWAASTDSTRFKRLRVDEAWIGTAYAGGGTTPPPGTFEAENGTCDGTIDSNHAGFTGTGFCNTTNAIGAFQEWTVPADTAGSKSLTFRFSNGTTVNRPMDISVNGTTVASGLTFNPTADWDTWATQTMTAALNAGNNTIRATATTANGGPNLDNLTVG